MPGDQFSDGTVHFLRRSVFVLGCAFLLVAILADPLGLSVGQGLSRNQVAFGVAGLVFITAGILGRRFPGVYRGTGVLLLNLLVALVAVEFLSLVVVKIIDAERFQRRAQKLTEGHAAEIENTIVLGKYAPFVVWRANPLLSTDSIQIGEDGRRFTPGVSDSQDVFQIFLLGGSAMWGSTVSDSATIGYYLQQNMTALLDTDGGGGLSETLHRSDFPQRRRSSS